MSNGIDDAKVIATDVFGEDDVIRRVDAVEALAEWGISPLVLMPVPSAQRWIPCSERMPQSNGVYIVTRTIDDGFTCADVVDACYFDGSNTWHDDTRVNHGRKYLNCIKAWMPLPEPYTKDGDTDDE